MQHRISRCLLTGIPLSFALCTPSWAADWVELQSEPEATLYTQPSTIQKEGNNATMWVLIDYKQPQPDKTGKQVMSDKLHYQYHCKDKTLSIIATTAYTGPMASGDIVNENPDAPQVTPIDPDTLAEDMWKQACGDIGQS
jgi:hypothetical protein